MTIRRRLVALENRAGMGARSIRDLSDADLDRAIGLLLAKAAGKAIGDDDAAFLASLPESPSSGLSDAAEIADVQACLDKMTHRSSR